MTRRKKTVAEQDATLDAVVNPTGAGEDSAVRELLQGEMATASDSEALEIALALRQIIRGQDMTLEQLKRQEQEIAVLKAEAAARDEATRRWQEDQKKFLDEVRDAAEKLRKTGLELDRLKAKAAQDTVAIMTEARMSAKLSAAKFDAELERMPKRTVLSPGNLIITTENGHQTTRLLPEEIRIRHRVWRLEPGVPTDVPEVVADLYSNRVRDKNVNRRMEKAMSEYLEANELKRKLDEIRKEAEAPYDPTKAPSPL